MQVDISLTPRRKRLVSTLLEVNPFQANGFKRQPAPPAPRAAASAAALATRRGLPGDERLGVSKPNRVSPQSVCVRVWVQGHVRAGGHGAPSQIPTWLTSSSLASIAALTASRSPSRHASKRVGIVAFYAADLWRVACAARHDTCDGCGRPTGMVLNLGTNRSNLFSRLERPDGAGGQPHASLPNRSPRGRLKKARPPPPVGLPRVEASPGRAF